MKILLLLLPLFAHSATITIQKPCLDESIKLTYTPLEASLGEDMMNILTENQIPFEGSIHGINTLLGTAVGLDSYEVISDERMRVYGWCYSVNGKNIDKLMSEYYPQKNDQIIWFYAYAEIIKDDWISYCTPVTTDLPICN